MGALEFIRYLLICYLAILEILYPFDSLPFSAKVKLTLFTHAYTLSYCLTVHSNFILIGLTSIYGFLITVRTVIKILLRFRPALKEETMVEIKIKALKRQQELEARGEVETEQKAKKEKNASLIICSVALVVNDAWFNRVIDENTSSLDGARERFLEVFNESLTLFYFHIAALIAALAVYGLFRSLWVACRGRRQAIVLDEESRPVSSDSESAEQGLTGGLNEKLIGFTDGVDAISEKVRSVMVEEPEASAQTQVPEEPLP